MSAMLSSAMLSRVRSLVANFVSPRATLGNAAAHDRDAMRRLRAEGVNAVRASTPAIMWANIVNSTILVVAFLDHAHHLVLGYWWAAVLLLSVSTLIATRRNRAYRSRGSVRSARRTVWRSILMGGVWAFPFPLLLPGATEPQALVLTGLATGMLSGGAFALVPVAGAAAAWTLMMTAGIICALFLKGGTFYLVAGALVLVYTAYTLSQSRGQFRDFAIRHAERERLAERNEVVELLLADHEGDDGGLTWRIDEHGRLVRASEGLTALLGGEPADDATLITQLENVTGSESADAIARLSRAVTGRERFTDIELHVRPRGAPRTEPRIIVFRGTPQFEEARFTGYRGIATDVTKSRRDELRIRYLATHDEPTGLVNRFAFHSELRDWLASERTFALVHVDVDGLKRVNDSRGEATGDAVLVGIAERLVHLAREVDGLVARTGGDEFGLALPASGSANARDTGSHIGRLALDAIRQPFAVASGIVEVRASAGFAAVPDDAGSLEQLVACAELALDQAKRDGGGRIRGHDTGLDRDQHARISLESDIGEALGRGELHLTFQPVVTIEDNAPRISAMEALLRWTHPERGAVSPVDFIPIAEDTGAILEIGDWVMRTACLEAATWSDPLIVSVNVSPLQILSDDFVAGVMSTLADTGLRPERLEIELTESVLMTERERVTAVIKVLRAIGVSFALDDFGTGFSSLSYLRDFAFDRIKIDRSFVRALTGSGEGERRELEAQALVRAIVDMGRSLGLAVTAEGVERREHARVLGDMGCNTHQGWLYGRPLAARAAAELTRFGKDADGLRERHRPGANIA